MKPTAETDSPKPDEESGRQSESSKETKLIKNLNKLVYKGNVRSRLDAEQTEQSNKRDEIPLIDDGVEETGKKSSPEEGASSQTRSNCEDSHRTDHVTDRSPSQSDRPQSNTTVSSDTPSIPADQPAAGLDQSQAQIMNSFQNINLNDDGVNEPHSSDLCQLDSVEQLNPDEQEEKERLIQQLLELRNTLDDLSNRVSSVREMSFKLTNENNVLNQYVENLMSASSVFVATNATNVKQRRQRK